jgi:tRNA(fMet)-specific endonuclease VapC
MKRYLMDTGIAGDYLNKRRGVFQRARQEQVKGNVIGICIPVLAELAFGMEKSLTRDPNLRILNAALPTIRLWPMEKSAAFEYGRLYAELLRLGRPIPVIDIMIAAVAKTLGSCTIVSKDSDFDVIPGLTVENWAT